MQLLQALAAFPAMLPLLRDAGIGFVYLTAILAGCGVAGKLFCRLRKSHCLDRLLDGLIALRFWISIRSIKTSSSRSQTKASRSPNLLPRRKKRMPFLPT